MYSLSFVVMSVLFYLLSLLKSNFFFFTFLSIFRVSSVINLVVFYLFFYLVSSSLFLLR